MQFYHPLSSPAPNGTVYFTHLAGSKILLEKASTTVSNLNLLYRDGDVFYKRQIASALFPQNLEYDGCGFRTAHLNEVISTIFSLSVTFKNKKADKMEPIHLIRLNQRPRAYNFRTIL